MNIRKKLRVKLKKIFDQRIRERDKNICQKCGKPVEGQNRHTSHVIPISATLRLAYDLLNAKILCFHCHINWWHKNPTEASEWFKEKFSERWDYLQKRKKEILKLGSVKDYELEEWCEELKGGNHGVGKEQ